VVASFVWFFSQWRDPQLPGLVLAFAVTGYAAALMVSSFSYLSLKQIDVSARVKYSYLAFVILPMLIMIKWDPPTMLFAMFISYATYGPVQWIGRKLRRPKPPSLPTT
jgi:phosphatidylserine synthase